MLKTKKPLKDVGSRVQLPANLNRDVITTQVNDPDWFGRVKPDYLIYLIELGVEIQKQRQLKALEEHFSKQKRKQHAAVA